MVWGNNNNRSLLVICVLTVAGVSFRRRGDSDVVGTDRYSACHLSGTTLKTPPPPSSSLAPLPPRRWQDHQHQPAWENTTWLGDVFVPPSDAKMYSPSELRSILRDHSILIVGDSTARRFYATLMQLLNNGPSSTTNTTNTPLSSSNPHVSRADAYRDYDKEPAYKGDTVTRCPKWDVDPVVSTQRYGSHCNKMTAAGTAGAAGAAAALSFRDDNGESEPASLPSIDYLGLQCYWMLEHFARQSSTPTGALWDATQEYTLVVVAAGIWEVKNPELCLGNPPAAAAAAAAPKKKQQQKPTKRQATTVDARLLSALDALNGLAMSRRHDDGGGNDDDNHGGLHLRWRTSGFWDTPDVVGRDMPLVLNKRAMETIDSYNNRLFRYVDWGGAIYPRSFGTDRIKGDIDTHYGPVARILMLQILANSLYVAGSSRSGGS